VLLAPPARLFCIARQQPFWNEKRDPFVPSQAIYLIKDFSLQPKPLGYLNDPYVEFQIEHLLALIGILGALVTGAVSGAARYFLST